MLNWKYYLAWLIVWPFYLLDTVIFFEIEKYRTWDDRIWLQRVLIWHDNLYINNEEYSYEETESDEEGETGYWVEDERLVFVSNPNEVMSSDSFDIEARLDLADSIIEQTNELQKIQAENKELKKALMHLITLNESGFAYSIDVKEYKNKFNLS